MSTWTHVNAQFRVDALRFDGEVDYDDVAGIVGKTLYDGFADIRLLEKELEPEGIKPYSSEFRAHPRYKEIGERSNESYDDYRKNPDEYVPVGSEGGLDVSVWVNPDDSCLAAFTISAFGDLRDFGSGDVEKVKSWFSRVCSKACIRQAVCQVNTEGYGEWILSLYPAYGLDDVPDVRETFFGEE